ncbi:hypothetical protein HOE22_09630 [Candidatus Woesearchaeota archaeon]|jgi:hypothetical protein|nr:hypothetical protein [Candidatus Woesearchaeota archaeon]MBT7558352.1 hypothetical protein [Candidatus Woesearchaeota archaeon]
MAKEHAEERVAKSLESIAESFRTFEDSFLELDLPIWSERLEWYLNEFYSLAKQKTVGGENRPDRDKERSR